MTAISPRPHANSPYLGPDSARRPSAELVSDAVVATYIHDISRHRRRRGVGPATGPRSGWRTKHRLPGARPVGRSESGLPVMS